MANPTTYFGWVMPTSSSLVTNLPADFNTFGQGVDTSLQDLLGGTTGQVLSKTSATNMDFTWVTPTDQTPLTTKGDLFTFTTVDARLGVGSDGQVLTASSAAATGLAWATASTAPTSYGYAAGKNAVINGDFTINQRNFTSTTTNNTYGHDRFSLQTNSTCTYSTQAFTPGTAPVAGYEGINFARMVTTTSAAAGEYAILQYKIEDVRSFAGETVTVSFWAKSGSGTPKVGTEFSSIYGSGGSGNVTGTGQSFTLSTSWTRYSATFSIGSVSGKTIGTSSYLEFNFWCAAGSTFATRSGSVGNQSATIDIWGVQIEEGSTATAFQTATGTLQGELALCQRYFQRLINGAEQSAENIGVMQCRGATTGIGSIQFLGPMRVAPTMSISSAGHFYRFDATGGSLQALSALSFQQTSPRRTRVDLTWTSGTTAGNATDLIIDNASGTMDASAEL